MELKQRIDAFVKLGNYFKELATLYNTTKSNFEDEKAFEILLKAEAQNGWFTAQNIEFALKSWSEALTEDNLKFWTSALHTENTTPRTVAIIMAGNIPLVGFHDFISVLISGHNVLVKLSSNDKVLLPFIADYLIQLNPEFKERITFADGRLENFDAVIATGSNNTARYFDYYFGKHPHIIRRNRNSVAVLTGKETKEELELLANDIFQYFGLGCRNVSKLYVPEDYSFDAFFEAAYTWKDIIHNHKYINNYDYNKAVYLMDNLSLLDNEFLLLKEDAAFYSPIAVLFYERYSSLENLRKELKIQTDNIQCVVSNSGIENEVPFGDAQKPKLWDYADGINTLEFLTNLSN